MLGPLRDNFYKMIIFSSLLSQKALSGKDIPWKIRIRTLKIVDIVILALRIRKTRNRLRISGLFTRSICSVLSYFVDYLL